MQLRPFVAVVGLAAIAAALGAAPALAGDGSRNDEDTTVEPEPDRPARRTKGYERTVALAIEDIQAFWASEFPSVYGAAYEPIPEDRIFAAEPGIDLPDCQGETLTYEDAEDNAFYCYRGNFIAYDDVSLFPQLFRDFGEFSIALVLAHEWGHAIQDRADNVEQPTILKELQADCFAGAWVATVDAGSARLEIQGGNLDQGLSAMLQFRDAPGSSPDDPLAHGSGFDRVSAFQQGFDESAATCATYFDTPPTIVESGIFTSPDNEARGGNLPPDEVIPQIVDLLNEFYAEVEPDYEALDLDQLVPYTAADDEEDLPTCGGALDAADVENRVFYCPDDGGYIAFDADYFGEVYSEIGDFAVGTLLASAWAVYVQDLKDFPGVEDNAANAILGADCYTGGFARALFDSDALDPGDLDETIQALVNEAAVLGAGEAVDVTFERLRALRGGFFFGYEVCDEAYGTGADTPESG